MAHNLRTLFLILLFAVSINAWPQAQSSEERKTSQPDFSSLKKPGDSVEEMSDDMGNGYRYVTKAIVNPPEIFEYIGHFGFAYYKKTQLCQCDSYERPISVSKNGRYALFTNDDEGRLTLFDASSGRFKKLSQCYVGAPYSADWGDKNDKVIIHLRHEIKISAGKYDFSYSTAKLNLKNERLSAAACIK